jgi:hypothetical protein
MCKLSIIFRKRNFFIFLFRHIFVFQKVFFLDFFSKFSKFSLLKKKHFFLLYILKLMVNFGFFNIYMFLFYRFKDFN